jgi:single-strand DNA-binding protein
MNLNSVILIGRLTRDPESKFLQSGMQVVNFGLAINNKRKDKKSGETIEETTFVDVAAFGKTADFIAQYIKKGGEIAIQGRLNFQEWEAKDGQKRSKLQVIADNVQGGARAEGQAQPKTSDGGPPGEAPF